MKRRDKQSHEQTANTPSNRTPPLNPQHRQKVQRTKPSIWSSNGGITGVSSLAEDLDGECDGSLWTSLFLLHFSTTRTTNTPSNRAINPSTQPATTEKKSRQLSLVCSRQTAESRVFRALLKPSMVIVMGLSGQARSSLLHFSTKRTTNTPSNRTTTLPPNPQQQQKKILKNKVQTIKPSIRYAVVKQRSHWCSEPC